MLRLSVPAAEAALWGCGNTREHHPLWASACLQRRPWAGRADPWGQQTESRNMDQRLINREDTEAMNPDFIALHMWQHFLGEKCLISSLFGCLDHMFVYIHFPAPYTISSASRNSAALCWLSIYSSDGSNLPSILKQQVKRAPASQAIEAKCTWAMLDLFPTRLPCSTTSRSLTF